MTNTHTYVRHYRCLTVHDVTNDTLQLPELHTMQGWVLISITSRGDMSLAASDLSCSRPL
jgi:hypothetical protein